MIGAVRKVRFVLFAALAACGGGSLPGNGPHLTLPFARVSQSHSPLPPELLYVAGGPPSGRHPFIEVFNARDTSPNPQPLYTIPPIEGGVYGRFAVDASNDLYAVNYFTNGAKLVVFPSGQTKPSIDCLLDNMPQGTYTAFHTLYLATPAYTIEEYKLPIRAAYVCPKPNAVLTDQRAKLRGTNGLWSPAVGPKGDVVDVWHQSFGNGNGSEIDVFPAGSKNARRFAGLPPYSGYSGLLSDSARNLVTDRASRLYAGESIAVFVHGSHTLKVFHRIPSGGYYGFARGNGGTELFASRGYPTTEVVVYAFDLKTGNVGLLLRSFTNIWRDAQSIAVFTR